MPEATITADQLRAVLFSTENSNKEEVLTKFSWAGNEKSSYSFGILQFDIARNHGNVKDFLASHGFTQEQIKSLSKQGGGLSDAELEPLNGQLAAIPKADLDEFTNRNLQESIDRIDVLIGSLRQTNPAVANAIAQSDELQLALADYDNQFHIDGIGRAAPKNSMLAYLEGQTVSKSGTTLKLDDTLTRSDLQNYINTTEYARTHQKAVTGREERLSGALADLNLIDPSQVAQSHSAEHGALRLGAKGDEVGDLQTKLAELGYTDLHGNPLEVDKGYGTNTKVAVEAFQRDHGLPIDGVAGRNTLEAIEEQRQALTHAQATRDTQAARCPVRLDDPTHPDNAFYLRTRELVHQLDQQNGRTPDQRSDQLASALTVQGRAAGLQRIDQVALSEDASALWGAQRPLGMRDHFYDQLCNINTVQGLNTPMEQSGAQWPQAMQQFQQVQEQAQQQRQQVQQAQDQAQQPGPAVQR